MNMFKELEYAETGVIKNLWKRVISTDKKTRKKDIIFVLQFPTLALISSMFPSTGWYPNLHVGCCHKTVLPKPTTSWNKLLEWMVCHRQNAFYLIWR